MSLRNEANAMRLRLKQMEDRSANPFSTAGSTPLVTPGIPSSRVEKEQQQSDAGAEEQVKGVQHTSATVAVLETEKYSRKLLERKIKKVDKMLNKSTPGTKEYKKLQKKRTEYKNQLGEVVKEEYVNSRITLNTIRQLKFGETEDRAKMNDPDLIQSCESKESAQILRKKNAREEARRLMQLALSRKKKAAWDIDADTTKREAMEKKRNKDEDNEENMEKYRRSISNNNDDNGTMNTTTNYQNLKEEPRLKQVALEKKRNQEEIIVKNQHQNQYEYNKNKDDSDDDKKRAYLEEAGRLKQEAIEKKKNQKEIEISKQQQYSYNNNNNDSDSDSDNDNDNDNDDNKKQAYLKEPRRLKQEAIEKKRDEKEMEVKNRKQHNYNDSDDDSDNKQAHLQYNCNNSVDSDDDDDDDAKQAYSESTGRLKQEITEEKVKQEAIGVQQQNQCLNYDDNDDKEHGRTNNLADRKDTTSDFRSLEQEVSKDSLDLGSFPVPYSDNTKKILADLESNEARRNKIENVLKQNGVAISESITYDEAKDKIAEITNSMKILMATETDSYTMEKKYFSLEEQLARYSTALMLTDEYAEEQLRAEENWERSIEADNITALRKLRSHMPVKIRHMTEEDLVTINLPKACARKFKRTNILQLLRVDPCDIEKMHPSLLESMRTTGLTLTERRAIHEHFRAIENIWTRKKSDPSIEKKWQWYQSLKSKFKEMLNAYSKCVEKYGPPPNHQYAKRNDPGGGGCPLLGNQCPIKADAAINYDEDYGYPKGDEYENLSNNFGSGLDSQRRSTWRQQNATTKDKSTEEDIMNELRSCLNLGVDESEVDKILLRKLFHSYTRIKNLEKQLVLADLSLPKENISYHVAKRKITELTEDLKEVAISMGKTSDDIDIVELEHQFGTLSKELDKYNSALMCTKEWEQEMILKEHQWEKMVSQANYKALQQILCHMPVNVKNMSETDLSALLTPNGKILPMAIIKKFKRTNILMILRIDPDTIESMHPSSLESMRTTSLTLTERRALHYHLTAVASKWKKRINDKSCEKKWIWYVSLKSKFREMLDKYDEHVKTCAGTGCPLIGNQCPVKADQVLSYTDDYGFPIHCEYEKQAVAKSNLLTMDEFEKRKREDECC